MEDKRYREKVKMKAGRILPVGKQWGHFSCRAGRREARRVNIDSFSLIRI